MAVKKEKQILQKRIRNFYKFLVHNFWSKNCAYAHIFLQFALEFTQNVLKCIYFMKIVVAQRVIVNLNIRTANRFIFHEFSFLIIKRFLWQLTILFFFFTSVRPTSAHLVSMRLWKKVCLFYILPIIKYRGKNNFLIGSKFQTEKGL